MARIKSTLYGDITRLETVTVVICASCTDEMRPRAFKLGCKMNIDTFLQT